MARKSVFVVAALTVLGSFAAVTPVASAGGDTTGPTLALARYANFVARSTIGPMAPEGGSPTETRDIQMMVSWSASDPSNICGSRTRSEYNGGTGAWSSWGILTGVVYPTTDYDDQVGGGSTKFLGIDVQVRDCLENRTTKFSRFQPEVFQENGESYGYGTLASAYSGTWNTSTCQCWSGGTTRKTTARGATAKFTFDFSGGKHPVALVMERAPDRGKAQILVDGVFQETIDTYAASPKHRSVVWVGKLPSGVHSVTVVNLATTGRPRIDVDAVLVSG
ncbi:MAG TPA: hypothetical protein VMT88_08460 [Actinomycetes bacterium]|nr:hypothetical protein [Actinomycetes bacterium]